MMNEQETLKKELERLRDAHSSLDAQINQAASGAIVNQLALQRLKRQKLALKDQIEKLRSKLLPDIIA